MNAVTNRDYVPHEQKKDQHDDWEAKDLHHQVEHQKQVIEDLQNQLNARERQVWDLQDQLQTIASQLQTSASQVWFLQNQLQTSASQELDLQQKLYACEQQLLHRTQLCSQQNEEKLKQANDQLLLMNDHLRQQLLIHEQKQRECMSTSLQPLVAGKEMFRYDTMSNVALAGMTHMQIFYDFENRPLARQDVDRFPSALLSILNEWGVPESVDVCLNVYAMKGRDKRYTSAMEPLQDKSSEDLQIKTFWVEDTWKSEVVDHKIVADMCRHGLTIPSYERYQTGFCIISSDCDFHGTIGTLRDSGFPVYLIGDTDSVKWNDFAGKCNGSAPFPLAQGRKSAKGRHGQRGTGDRNGRAGRGAMT